MSSTIKQEKVDWYLANGYKFIKSDKQAYQLIRRKLKDSGKHVQRYKHTQVCTHSILDIKKGNLFKFVRLGLNREYSALHIVVVK